MSVDGNWKLTVQAPMGPQEMELVVTTSGETLQGTLSGQMGKSDVLGQVSGENLSWSAKIKVPMSMTLKFKTVVEDDKMEGEVKFGTFGKGAVTGVRQ